MLRGLPLVLLATGGCFVKPVPPGGQSCSAGVFRAATQFADPDPTTVDYDTTLPEDGLELWFANPEQADVHLFFAQRSSPQVAFGPKMPAPFTSSAWTDHEASITGDGLRLVFLSTRNASGNQPWEIARPTRDLPFGRNPTLLPGLETTAMRSIDVTLDGNRLYFSTTDGVLSVATRGANAVFGAPVLQGSGIGYPSISPDELEVFYQPIVNGNEEIRVARSTRETIDQQFGAPEEVIPVGEDPEISWDDRTLYYTVDGAISSMTRDCP